MDISEFNYFNNLQNRMAKVKGEIESEKKSYLKKMTNLSQLKNDYDVDTLDQLVSVLNNGDEDQTSVDLKNALQNHDKQYLLNNLQAIDEADFEQIKELEQELMMVKHNLVNATKFYNQTAIPVVSKMEKSPLIRIDELNSSGDGTDLLLEIDYFATYDDFKDDFKNAEFVPEIIEKHLEEHSQISVMITADNYPNQFDITIMGKEGE